MELGTEMAVELQMVLRLLLAAGAGLYLVAGVTTAIALGVLFLPHHIRQ